MELKDFVKSTILDILSGVEEAKNESGKSLIPAGGHIGEGNIPCMITSAVGAETKCFSNIEFEVSITESAKDGSKNGIGVLLGSFSLGTHNSSENANGAYTKVKFNIPINLD